MTYLMLPQSIKEALGQLADQREDLARPKRHAQASGH